MIKITIIIVLILLLFLTLYSYYYLSYQMIEFKKKRLEYILKKETELKNLEQKINIISDCSNKNEQYQIAIKNINTIIDKLNLPPGSICKKYNHNHDKKIIDNIKDLIFDKNILQQDQF